MEEAVTLTQSSLTEGPAPTRNALSFLSHEKRTQRLPFFRCIIELAARGTHLEDGQRGKACTGMSP